MTIAVPAYSIDNNLREVPKSVEEFQKFIETCRQQIRSQSLEDKISTLANLGFCLRVIGRLSEASAVCKEVLALCSTSDINRLVSAKLRLASIYQWQKRFELSNEIFDDIEFVYLNIVTSDQVKGFYWQHRGKNEFDQKNFSKAFSYFEKALEIRIKYSAPKELIESSQFAIARVNEIISEISEKNKRQIVSIGGGGFSMEMNNPLLDLYVLETAKKKKPKICFVGTASGDAQGYIDRFYEAFNRYDCVPSHLSLFRGQFTDLSELILTQDIIYVGGGNTKNMLAIWKEWALDKILYEAYQKGVIMAGISAGAICWFDKTLTDSIPGQLTALNGLSWIKGFCIPHFDGEAKRRPSTIQAIHENQIGKNGFGIDDGAAVHFINENYFQTVCSQQMKTSYQFAGGVEKKPEKSLFLGDR
jgi:dipeptidase E